MSEIEALELIADHLYGIRISLVGIGYALWLMLLFKKWEVSEHGYSD